MTTSVGSQKDFIEALMNLVELNYAVTASYKEAIEHIKDEECKNKLKDFNVEHEIHIKELSEILKDLGKEPPKSAVIKQLFTQGKIMFANLIGDKAILRALKTNEDDTNTAYERMNGHPNKAAYATDPLKRGLDDEKQHRIWMEKKLEELK